MKPAPGSPSLAIQAILVIPAKAGISLLAGTPAFAVVTAHGGRHA